MKKVVMAMILCSLIIACSGCRNLQNEDSTSDNSTSVQSSQGQLLSSGAVEGDSQNANQEQSLNAASNTQTSQKQDLNDTLSTINDLEDTLSGIDEVNDKDLNIPTP